MKTRFDLEQEIMKCWNVVEDVKLLNKYVLEGTPEGAELSKDYIANYLLALETVYELKFQELWNTFEHLTNTQQL
jgi:hypothetical protein